MDFDDEYEIDPKDLEKLDPEDQEKVKKLIQDYNFELAFYRAIAETDDFEVIPYPDENGNYMDSQELKLLILNLHRENRKPLIRVSHGKVATVYDKDTQKVGVMPNTDADGFSC